MTESLAGLLQEGLIELKCAAQDGMRVRASAGTSSFARQPKLEESLQEARAHVEKLRVECENDSAGVTLREKKARERAAREKVARIEKALVHVKEIAQQRETRKKGDGAAARASTTDPEARNMKMPDSGFRQEKTARVVHREPWVTVMGLARRILCCYDSAIGPRGPAGKKSRARRGEST
jgi:hypothetical protein